MCTRPSKSAARTSVEAERARAARQGGVAGALDEPRLAAPRGGAQLVDHRLAQRVPVEVLEQPFARHELAAPVLRQRLRESFGQPGVAGQEQPLPGAARGDAVERLRDRPEEAPPRLVEAALEPVALERDLLPRTG